MVANACRTDELPGAPGCSNLIIVGAWNTLISGCLYWPAMPMKDESQKMHEQTLGYFGNNVAPLPRIVIDSLIAS